MEKMDIFKLSLLALGALLAVLSVKGAKSDYAPVMRTACAVVFCVFFIDTLLPVISFLHGKKEGAPSCGSVLYKSVLIGLVSSVTCEICRDAGEPALASKVEMCAKAMLLVLALPLFEELLTLSGI